MSLLRVEGLSVTYPSGAWAVRGVDLRLDEGTCLMLVGESGSGKTTIILAILGLLPPGTEVAGSIMLAGEQLVGMPARRRRELLGDVIGFVPQNPFAACDPLRSVKDHLRQAWRAHGRHPDPRELDELLIAVGLDPARAGQRPHQWSGGMLQRLTIAAATAHHPALILADEPTSALDAERRDDVLRLLRERSPSLIVVTHDLTLVTCWADEVAVLYAGRVVETGPARLALNPRHPFTRALVAATPRRGHDIPLALAGDTPDSTVTAPGCAFAARCALVTDSCWTQTPPLISGVACPVVRS